LHHCLRRDHHNSATGYRSREYRKDLINIIPGI
jgi:hypothetical protein